MPLIGWLESEDRRALENKDHARKRRSPPNYIRETKNRIGACIEQNELYFIGISAKFNLKYDLLSRGYIFEAVFVFCRLFRFRGIFDLHVLDNHC